MLFYVASFAQALGTTAKVKNFLKSWNFLKYHHPDMAVGYKDWDFAFMANLPAIMKAKNSTQFNAVLTTLIDAAGKLEESGEKIT